MQTKGQDTLKEEEDENMNNSVTLKLTWGCSLSLLNFGEEGCPPDYGESLYFIYKPRE